MPVAWSAEKGWHETDEEASACTVCAARGVFRWMKTCAEHGHHVAAGE